MRRVLPIEAAGYVADRLHGDDRQWPETNCYADVWIEALHALGLDPTPLLAFVLSTDFDGDQWRFFKFPLSDLRAVYGVEAFEMNPWRGVEHHVEEQLGDGRLLSVEVDAFFLPDTAGTSYRSAHVKTTVITNMIDRGAGRLGYFHNTGYHELGGEDFAGIFRHHLGGQPDVLPPYVELIRLDRVRRPEADVLTDQAWALVGAHLARRPAENPVQAMGKQILDDLTWLRDGDMELFHDYAFATVRQCGASAELAASLCSWLEASPTSGDEPRRRAAKAGAQFAELSQAMKTAQFKLARVVAGRQADLSALWDDAAGTYEQAIDELLAVNR